MCYLYTLQYLLFKAKIWPKIAAVKMKISFLSRTLGEFQEHFTILEGKKSISRTLKGFLWTLTAYYDRTIYRSASLTSLVSQRKQITSSTKSSLRAASNLHT